MNRLIPMLVVLCALYTAAVLTAQGPDIKPDTVKFATVSFNAAVYQTAETQKELKQLQAKFGPRQAELQALNADIEGARKQLGIANDKLSDAERAQREQALNNKEKQLQRRAEDFKNDSDSESQQVFQRIAQKVYSFLQSYSKQHGYTLVIERGSDAAPLCGTPQMPSISQINSSNHMTPGRQVHL